MSARVESVHKRQVAAELGPEREDGPDARECVFPDEEAVAVQKSRSGLQVRELQHRIERDLQLNWGRAESGAANEYRCA